MESSQCLVCISNIYSFISRLQASSFCEHNGWSACTASNSKCARVVVKRFSVTYRYIFTISFVSTPPSTHVIYKLAMESGNVIIDSDMAYPIIFMPKKCTTLETNCEITDNVYIDVNIISPDTEGNDTIIYNGFCNIKLVDSYEVNLNRPAIEAPESNNIDQMPVIISEANNLYPPYSQSQVWIDPSRSPYVYNHYDPVSNEQYSIRETGGLITVEQHNTYITQNVYNCSESNVFNYKEASPAREVECKRYRKVQESVMGQSDNNMSYYGEDEFECGVFLSQLPEEIMNEKQTKNRDEKKPNKNSEKKFDIAQENNALAQLMSSDIQSTSKQRKTILFLGHDSQSGQTIQNISYNDPFMKCAEIEVDNEVVIEETPNPRKKKYQCDKCKQIFDQISSFRQHMVGKHTGHKRPHPEKELSFMCADCGKTLKNQRKFEIHCLGHGDPDLECHKCGKVFASKFSLRVHMKIHNRKYQCKYCIKSYDVYEDLRSHMSKLHFRFMCDDENCSFVTRKASDLDKHQRWHDKLNVESTTQDGLADETTVKSEGQIDQDLQNSEIGQNLSEPEPSLDFNNRAENMKEALNESNVLRSSSDEESRDFGRSEDFSVPKEKRPSVDEERGERIRKADSVIATVMSNSIFLLSTKKARRHRYRKTCEVCQKSFDRIDDLKRHLIEHVIKSTLAKTPVTITGILNITCEVCQTETFSKVDKYKTHLREHAKLTIYKCTFCDKSFSDSSNFSKHKKIHGVSFLQCDLCLRKFNSKKMIAQHMEQHRRTRPVQCSYCPRVFHFESMLKKHIRGTHRKEESSKYRCRFCEVISGSLKEKWEHEWRAHNVRKMIVDCLICGAQYRKYSELKRHCLVEHYVDIPTAKKLLKKRYRADFD